MAGRFHEQRRDVAAKVELRVARHRLVAFQFQVLGCQQQFVRLGLALKRVKVGVGPRLMPIGDDLVWMIARNRP